MYRPIAEPGRVVSLTDSVGRPRDCYGAATHAGLVIFARVDFPPYRGFRGVHPSRPYPFRTWFVLVSR